jgi:SHAQKYF class myb-like DNA-binding protein
MEQYQDGRPKRRLTEDYGDQKVSKRQNPVEHVGEWNEHLHRSFVAAVFETGLKHASPSVIMEQMTLSMAAITSERVKSHLQKYRNNKEKNKAQFMEEYDGFMQKALTVGTAGGKVSRSNGGANTSFLTPEALVRMLGAESIIGGDLPALLTYAVMHDDGLPEPHQSSSQMASSILTYPPQPNGLSPPNLSINAIKSGSQEFTSYMSKQDGTKIPFPVLSEEERRSPLGESICHVMALFCSLTQQIVAERAKQGEESSSQSLPHVLSAEFRGDSDDENE